MWQSCVCVCVCVCMWHMTVSQDCHTHTAPARLSHDPAARRSDPPAGSRGSRARALCARRRSARVLSSVRGVVSLALVLFAYSWCRLNCDWYKKSRFTFFVAFGISQFCHRPLHSGFTYANTHSGTQPHTHTHRERERSFSVNQRKLINKTLSRLPNTGKKTLSLLTSWWKKLASACFFSLVFPSQKNLSCWHFCGPGKKQLDD